MTLHTIFLGAGGSIYTSNTLHRLKELGLDSQRAHKTALKLHVHLKPSRESITSYLPLHYSCFEPRLQRGLSICSSFATGSYAAGGRVKYAGLGSLAYFAAKTFHRFHAAFKSLCIWNAGCVFFTLALCARTAAWSPPPTIPPPA